MTKIKKNPKLSKCVEICPKLSKHCRKMTKKISKFGKKNVENHQVWEGDLHFSHLIIYNLYVMKYYFDYLDFYHVIFCQ